MKIRRFAASALAIAALILTTAARAADTGTAGRAVPRPTAPQKAGKTTPAAIPTPSASAELEFPTLLGLTAFRGGVSPAELSVDWVSGVELVWQDAEPTKGSYDWTVLDGKIGLVDSAGAMPIPILVPRSAWGGSPVPSESEGLSSPARQLKAPTDLEAWGAFVRAVVERYDGDRIDDMPGLLHPVRAWQLMPDLTETWASDSPTTIDYLRATHDAAKAANPNAFCVLGKISHHDMDLVALARGHIKSVPGDERPLTLGALRGTPALRDRVDFLNDVLIKGKDSYAAINLAHYSTSQGALERVQYVEKFFADNKIGEKAIWSLENILPTIRGGMPDAPSVSSELVRTAISAILGGCRRFAWPAEAAGLPPVTTLAPYPLLDGAKTPQPSMQVFADLAKRLKGLDRLVLWRSPDESSDVRVVHVETTSSVPFTVVWNQANIDVKASFPAGGPVTVRDAVSGKISVARPIKGKVSIDVGPFPLYLTGIVEPGTTPPKPAGKAKAPAKVAGPAKGGSTGTDTSKIK